MNMMKTLGEAMNRVDESDDDLTEKLEQAVSDTLQKIPFNKDDGPAGRLERIRDMMESYKSQELEQISLDQEDIKRIKADCEQKIDDLNRCIAARRNAVAACDKFLSAGEEEAPPKRTRKPRAKKEVVEAPAKPTLVKQAA